MPHKNQAASPLRGPTFLPYTNWYWFLICWTTFKSGCVIKLCNNNKKTTHRRWEGNLFAHIKPQPIFDVDTKWRFPERIDVFISLHLNAFFVCIECAVGKGESRTTTPIEHNFMQKLHPEEKSANSLYNNPRKWEYFHHQWRINIYPLFGYSSFDFIHFLFDNFDKSRIIVDWSW